MACIGVQHTDVALDCRAEGRESLKIEKAIYDVTKLNKCNFYDSSKKKEDEDVHYKSVETDDISICFAF